MDAAPEKVIIAHPMDSFSPDQGGGIRYLMNLLNRLVVSGSLVTAIGMQTGLQTSASNWQQIPLIRRNSALFGWLPYWVRYLLALYARLPFLSLSTDAVVIAHRMDCMLAFVLFKPRNPKVLLSATPAYYLRINHPVVYRFLGWFYHLAESVCVRGVDFIVPTDRRTSDYYQRRYPDAAITECLPSPIDFAHFRLIDPRTARALLHWPSDAPSVLFVGRLSKVKNIPLLLRAFERVKDAYPYARLYIVGDGEDRDEIHEAALRACNDVILTGSVPPQEIPPYYAASNLLVLCSLEEGSPTVVKEALASGTPVVSTDVGDVAEVLDAGDDLGIIVQPEAASLAHGILEILARRSDNATRARRRKSVEKFSNDRTGSKLIQVCNRAIEKRDSTIVAVNE